jgi:hypothetical protein
MSLDGFIAGPNGGPYNPWATGVPHPRYQEVLEDTLDDCLASGRPTFVDLSGVRNRGG